MRTVVTGAAGFIGSTLTDRLLGRGHSVLGLDDLSTGSTANLGLARTRSRFSLVEADVASSVARAAIVEARPEVVFHLAAQMDVRHSVADPLDDARRNVLGTINVLEAARLAGARKLVFASSGGSIYGDQESLPVSEDARVDPHAPYAASKVCGETYLQVYRNLYGLQTTALALGNVYGPRQDPHGEAGVVAIFATAMLEGRPTAVFGDGTSTRDYVYVDDVVDAFLAAAGPVGDGLRLNVGTGRETSVVELHRLIAGLLGVPAHPRVLPPRDGELARVALDCSAAERVMGWRPRTSLVEGLRITMDWLRDSVGPTTERRTA